jgi:hypothetical protein
MGYPHWPNCEPLISPSRPRTFLPLIRRSLGRSWPPRADRSLSPREREEVDLIDAKLDLRGGTQTRDRRLQRAKGKLEQFLKNARTPEYLSEARGWLAHVHYLLGEQSEAGKIYLDELNCADSNLSQQTLLNSLRLTYGYDGGPELLRHLEDYFDTPEHAAFAIGLATNPRWAREIVWERGVEREPIIEVPAPYAQITSLLERHKSLFRSERGASILALLSMRIALSSGDPKAALRISAHIPSRATVRADPDFCWMLAAAQFLSKHYASAEAPLLRLFRSSRASKDQRAAAAHALCGVYAKLGNRVEQIRYALWLHTAVRKEQMDLGNPSQIEDQTVYWAVSGWDLSLLLDAEAPIEALRAFLAKYSDVPDVQLVRYSLAVRLARENQYEEAAELYAPVNAARRAARMRQLAAIYREANRADLPAAGRHEAEYRLAEFLSANPDRLYFNDRLWYGLQRYALFAEKDTRLTRAERQKLTAAERKLKDDQEERWRAYLLLRKVVAESGPGEIGRKSQQLALRCLRRLSERFGREDEIRAGIVELSAWPRRPLARRSPGA